MIAKDRTDAGEKLAQQLSQYLRKPDALMLALQRSGVPNVIAFTMTSRLVYSVAK